jgi:DNA-binding IclR family transcriptional regulator
VGTPKNQSILKAFSILQSFKAPDEWLTSAELSRRARLPGASGYRLVHTLEQIGAVVRDSRGRFRPGMLLLTLSQDIIAGELWREVSQSILGELAAELNLTVNVGVLEAGMVTYVAKAGDSPLSLRTQVGAQLEAYCTALGRVLLAALSAEALEAFLREGDLIALTEHTVTDPGAFLAQVARVRSQGYAVDDRETLDDLRCLGAAIRNPAGETVAAISVSDNARLMTEARLDDLKGVVMSAAEAIGARLYPRGASIRPDLGCSRNRDNLCADYGAADSRLAGRQKTKTYLGALAG